MEIKKSPACRKKGETKAECVSRKIPEIMNEDPSMKQDQAIAIAESVCSTSCGTKKCLTKEAIIELSDKDYLTLPEISKRALVQVRPDMLYRTHMALHKNSASDVGSKKVINKHKLVADEILARGFMHHQWDSLDSIYQK